MDNVIPAHITASPGPVALFGYARPRPGRADDLHRTLVSFVAPTRAEDGVEAYFVHADPARPGEIAFYERWASGAALSRHLARAEMQDFLARRHDLLDGDLEISFLDPLEPA